MTRAITRDACSLEDFRAVVEVDSEHPLHAARLVDGVPVYAASALRDAIVDDVAERSIRDELATVLSTGPGIFVIAGAFEADVVERANGAYWSMIERQREEGRAVGDHFAKPGANDRVWNAIEKLAVDAPEVFVDYYSNDMLGLACLAWLGPGYQISSQVNVVNPGGQAQQPHRDYHLGFMTDDEAERYPYHAHLLSPMLTLQAAVAHCDMPVETGPTMYLPHSQKYELGYLAWRRPEFIEYFAERRTQLALGLGDLVCFNPALFHAAGSNVTTDVRRIANLLQVSSAMGRAMETMDRIRMSLAVYPALLSRADGGMSAGDLARVVVACADGYAFPTNLDSDPPLDGLSPRSHADLVADALARRAPRDELARELDDLVARRRSA